MRFLTILTTLSLAGLAAACTGDDPVEPGTGSASAAITDNAHEVDAMQASGDVTPRILAHGEYSGRLSSSATVEISANGAAWVELGSPTAVMVTLQSHAEETTVNTRASVPVGTYNLVRLTLSGAEAEIEAGGVIGGITLASAVGIRVGGSDGEVVIEKEVEPFTVKADTHVRILFDLNSEGWVTEESAEDQMAEDEEVRGSARAGRSVEEEA